jgi:GMP synthase (glutamine-hydrolysing)
MDTIAVLDFGGQYAHLIANRIRRLGVYSEIVENGAPASALGRFRGIVLSGGPRSVTEPDAPRFDRGVLDLGVPVLGLCYGHQLIAQTLGGRVERGEVREYGIAFVDIVNDDPFFAGTPRRQQVWMSHGDTVKTLPAGFEVLGSTADCVAAAVRDVSRPIYGLQFHPEVTDTPNGQRMLDNFLNVCGCRREWNAAGYLREIEANVRHRCEGKKVFLLVSGGVDSSVAFVLLNNLLGRGRVLGLHIDNGLMRLDESVEVMRYMKAHGFDNLRICDASEEFLEALRGISEPEAKRKAIGRTFIEVQQKALAGMGLNVAEWMLGQGTIYPDTIESAGTRHADRIKTHHNRVDIVKELMEQGLVIEPLAQLYKDEVRELGEAQGLPRSLVWRHPFPGPGLGVRVLCSEGTAEPVADDTQRSVTAAAASHGYRATVLPVRSVGVQGDERTYAHPVLLDGRQDWAVLEKASTAITNSIKGVNRVLYGVRTGGTAYRLIRAHVTRERLDLLRAIDHQVTQLLHRHGQYDAIWQMPVVLLPLVNPAGGQCVVLRPITSTDAMTARFAPLNDEILEGIRAAAGRIDGIGDIFMDITHKPPGTIEWE